MPIRTHIPNIEAIRAEIATLEEQRGILKSPEMIAALKAEIASLSFQRLKALAEIDEAKKSLDDTVEKQTEQAEIKLKELQTQYAPEQERLEALRKEASIKLIDVRTELINKQNEMDEMIAVGEEAKKSADEYLAKIAAQTEEKLKKLNDRRNTCRQEVDMLYQTLQDDKSGLEDRGRQIIAYEQELIEKEKTLALQTAMLNEAKKREQEFTSEQETALKLEFDKLNVRKGILADKDKTITEREDRALVQEVGLSNFKMELDLREQRVIQDKQDLAPKWDEILKREADLETNWRVYKKAKQVLDYKLREIEG